MSCGDIVIGYRDFAGRWRVHPGPGRSGFEPARPVGGYCRWRIGDWRVIARIEDAGIAILVVRAAHRREA